MTTIDHAAEARTHAQNSLDLAELNLAKFDDKWRGAIEVDLAQVHATLALVEAQREANEIARIQAMLTLTVTPEKMREATVDELGKERLERILKGLGL